MEAEKDVQRKTLEAFTPDEIIAACKVIVIIRDRPDDERKAFQRELRRLVSLDAGLDPGALIHPDEIILRFTPEMIHAAALKALD